MLRIHIYDKVSGLFPNRFVNWLSRFMAQGGFDEISSRTYLGFSIFFSIALAVIAFFAAAIFSEDLLVRVATPVLVLVLALFSFYLLLALSAESRAQKIEEVLPEALQIISANIRSGMTLENAIWGSARSEFGPLKDEIKRVSSDTFSGVPIDRALRKMSDRVKSTILERAVKLIYEGISLGGEMAPLLEAVSLDIRNIQLLRKEISTSTLTYAIFIVFAGVIAAPLLFSVSTFYSEINAGIMEKQYQRSAGGTSLDTAAQRAGVAGLPGIGTRSKPSEDAITPQDVYWFALASIILTSLCAGLLVGLVQTGKAVNGIKYSPFFIILSLALFTLLLNVLRATIGTLAV